MQRCVAAVMVALTLVLSPTLSAAPAAAQAYAPIRNFPAKALRGELRIAQPPEAELNGRPARLAPGLRIRGENNLLLMSGAVAGQKLVVNYTLDEYGLVKDVWVLTAAERDRDPWPRTREQAAAWQFDPVGQTWTKP